VAQVYYGPDVLSVIQQTVSVGALKVTHITAWDSRVDASYLKSLVPCQRRW